MTDNTNRRDNSPTSVEQAKKRRLSEALRANLRKRKMQARTKQSGLPDQDSRDISNTDSPDTGKPT